MEWGQALKIFNEALAAGFALYLLWAMSPKLRIALQAEWRRLAGPFVAARTQLRAINEMWADVIHLQTFGPAALERGQAQC